MAGVLRRRVMRTSWRKAALNLGERICASWQFWGVRMSGRRGTVPLAGTVWLGIGFMEGGGSVELDVSVFREGAAEELGTVGVFLADD